MAKQQPKTTPWNKIKAEYLEGVKPKELAIKYEITAKSITDKASNNNWGRQKTIINEKITQNIIQAEITRTERQLSLSKLLADKIESALLSNFIKGTANDGTTSYIDFKPQDLKALTSSLLDLQKVERTAEGLDKYLKEDNKDDDEIIVRFV